VGSGVAEAPGKSFLLGKKKGGWTRRAKPAAALRGTGPRTQKREKRTEEKGSIIRSRRKEQLKKIGGKRKGGQNKLQKGCTTLGARRPGGLYQHGGFHLRGKGFVKKKKSLPCAKKGGGLKGDEGARPGQKETGGERARADGRNRDESSIRKGGGKSKSKGKPSSSNLIGKGKHGEKKLLLEKRKDPIERSNFFV